MNNKALTLDELKESLRNQANDNQSNEVLISIKDIYKIYKMGDSLVKANDGISFDIRKGEMVAIVGQSGSGKSTVMNILGALDVPTKGKYYLNGYDVSKMNDDELAYIRNRTIGFIFQQYNLIANHTVIQNVEIPLLYGGVKEKERHIRAMEALSRVGLEGKENNLPKQLSGGQQQRVSIARALVNNPSIILADEPTGALDSATGKEVLNLLKDLNNDGNTIILITHDNHIAEQAKRIIRISDGKIVFDGETKEYVDGFLANN